MKVGLMADSHDRIPAIAELLRLMHEAGATMVLHDTLVRRGHSATWHPARRKRPSLHKEHCKVGKNGLMTKAATRFQFGLMNINIVTEKSHYFGVGGTPMTTEEIDNATSSVFQLARTIRT